MKNNEAHVFKGRLLCRHDKHPKFSGSIVQDHFAVLEGITNP